MDKILNKINSNLSIWHCNDFSLTIRSDNFSQYSIKSRLNRHERRARSSNRFRPVKVSRMTGLKYTNYQKLG